MKPARYVAKLTVKGRSTIPSPVRKHLGLKPGDAVVFTIERDNVTIDRVARLDDGLLKLANENFSDWNSPEADEAFADL